MGCDIHVYCEDRKSDGKWFGWDGEDLLSHRSYAVFGFLAGVRNYSAITPISLPRGIPADASGYTREEWGNGAFFHSASWLTIKELLEFNYDAICEDRRVTRNGDGGCTCATGEGRLMTYREFLGIQFFVDLNQLRGDGVERIVFWFDS